MTDPVTREDLMRYLDDELLPSDRVRVQEALARSTELQRELSIYRALSDDFRALSFAPDAPGSVWQEVNRRVARPTGWILVVVGGVLWIGYISWLFVTSPANLVEKLAVGTLSIGFAILLGSVIWERMDDWQTDPYRDIHR